MNGPAPKEKLPRLRADLRLIEGAPSLAGEPRWLIHDPLQQRFIQIEPTAYRLLALWPYHETAEGLAAAARERFHVDVDCEQIARFGQFLSANLLTIDGRGLEWRALHHRATARHSLFSRVLHNYLFVRVPLCRPTAFLRATYPAISFLFTRSALVAFAVVGLVGLYLASRQWDAFLTTFQYFFSLEGALASAATLGFVKLMHELGHAYMAVRFGCAVPTMGIAFVVMTPMPYTDVTDSWRLRDRRQRLLIDAAGILAELAIAAIAILLWVFLPDGMMRSAAFMLATVSLVSSLLVNVNPLMRFDGYYLLSEMLGIENLQPRAFAVGRWRLRELLFGLGRPCPESFSLATRRILYLYAWTIWVYRLVVFFGIALFVYHYFFKALGIFLFAVEIVYFIARPIWSELRMWNAMRSDILARRRTLATASLLIALIGAALVPWSTSVHVPAMLEVADCVPLYPPTKAQVERIEVAQGERVRSGQTIAVLRSPFTEQQLTLAEARLRLTNLRLVRRVGDADDREASVILEHERRSLQTKIAGLREELGRLTIAAPADGVVLELNRSLHPGRWIGARDMVAMVGDPSRASARGYLAEGDTWRVTNGSAGVFVPETPTGAAIAVHLTDVALAGAQAIDLKELSSSFGGHVATKPEGQSRQQRELPVTGQYLAQFATSEHGPARPLRGMIQLSGAPESLAARTWRQVLKVLIREGGA